MHQPERLWQQYLGKARAEFARGAGYWPLQPHPCDLEPPWEDYVRRWLTRWDCVFNGWEGPWDEGLFSRAPLVHKYNEPLLLPRADCHGVEEKVAIVVKQFPEDEATIPKAEQLLLALPVLTCPVSFEMLIRHILSL